MEVPEFFGLPFLGDGDAAVRQGACLERLARGFADDAAVLLDLDAKSERGVRGEALKCGADCDLTFANRRIDLQVGDARRRRSASEEDVAAQATPLHRVFYLSGRVGVGVGVKDA